MVICKIKKRQQLYGAIKIEEFLSLLGNIKFLTVLFFSFAHKFVEFYCVELCNTLSVKSLWFYYGVFKL